MEVGSGHDNVIAKRNGFLTELLIRSPMHLDLVVQGPDSGSACIPAAYELRPHGEEVVAGRLDGSGVCTLA
eukprot:7943068-Pyramimonas_sp.AAC.2